MTKSLDPEPISIVIRNIEMKLNTLTFDILPNQAIMKNNKTISTSTVNAKPPMRSSTRIVYKSMYIFYNAQLMSEADLHQFTIVIMEYITNGAQIIVAIILLLHKGEVETQ